MYNIKTKIKKIREFTKLSQKDFAKKFYLDIERVKYWEKRPGKPPQSVIDTIIERLLKENIINDMNIHCLESKPKTKYNYKKETIKSKVEYILNENH